MSSPKVVNPEREQHILDAAANLIIQYGYDKTSIGDIAEHASVSRGIIYLHFANKEALFDVLIRRELLNYAQVWLEYIEADPQGGTIGGIYRAVIYAINHRPFMTALMRRDRRVMGNYLRKPNNMFAALQSSSLWSDVLREMQAAGVIRPEIDPIVIAHVMDVFSYGLMSLSDFNQPQHVPPFETTLNTFADLMDQVLTPDGGGNREAGKAIIHKLAAQAQTYFDKMKPSQEG